ncbi:unnamed protein product [Didymodactylos carnosus]|uniref:diacylglycerol O-acyltransferase n=1 Tax=Didymodactylos carnosus TaxID=1234261 RepID=A0A815HN13_9BILA|nr:unnamed protein product [Didymodactylos carnosus]CAF4227564.1 unnamed protein product [Didymodactylos carnosus]
MGVCDASKKSCNYILEHGHGNSLMLVLGGAKEALDARPSHQYILTLKNRKGFVKIGLVNGAGRGVFQYAIGFLPNRHRIYTYVGEPIQLPKLERNQITPDIVDQYHKQYMNALTRLFDRYKSEHDQSDATIIYANDDVSSL